MACDLLDARRLAQVMQELQPELIIHAQAFSDVDRCELEPSTARAQNVQTVATLIQAVDGLPAWLLALSTDYVFDGAKAAPYDEADVPNPLSVYGNTKLEGERLVLSAPRSVVVRTSTLFGPGRMNCCDAIISQATSGRPVEAFLDQATSPTYTDDLAEGLAALGHALWRSGDASWPRIYHLANAGSVSRAAFASRIAELLGCAPELVHPVPMAQQRRPALRPPYSALTTIHVGRVLGRTLRSWEDALRAYLCRHPVARSRLQAGLCA